MKRILATALQLVAAGLFSSQAIAQTHMVGDWVVDSGPNFQEAGTTNASGSTAGVWCSLQTQTCFAYIRTARPCDNGTTVPILVNSALGSVAGNSTCVKVPGANGQPLEFSSVDLGMFEKVAESGSEFAFAMPLVGGQFAVMRFSSQGATEAIRQATSLPKGTVARPSDQVL